MSNRNLEENEVTIGEVLSRWNEVLHAVSNSVTNNQKVIKILVISFVFDILFTLLIAFGAITLHDTTHQYIIDTCHSTNAFKTADKKIWEYVLSVDSANNQNPNTKKELINFEKYLDTVMAPKTCK